MLYDSRFYYGVGILIILLSVVVFSWQFERRKPRTREIVMIAVMVTFGVMGRVLFYMTPQVKPSAAIVIISGIALGKEAGFLTGVLTAFISNFFVGQGPWTPWQMIAFGILGYIFGVIYFQKMKRTRIGQKEKLKISIQGMLATIVIYGGIMDSATVLMSTAQITTKTFLSVYSVGFVMNVIHGFSTFIFLWFLLIPMVKKIKRMNVKYGIYQGEEKNHIQNRQSEKFI